MSPKPTPSELRRAKGSTRFEDAPNPRLGITKPVGGPAPALTRVPSKSSTRGREEGSSVKDRDARKADEPRQPFANEVIVADAIEDVLTPDGGTPSRTQPVQPPAEPNEQPVTPEPKAEKKKSKKKDDE